MFVFEYLGDQPTCQADHPESSLFLQNPMPGGGKEKPLKKGYSTCLQENQVYSQDLPPSVGSTQNASEACMGRAVVSQHPELTLEIEAVPLINWEGWKKMSHDHIGGLCIHKLLFYFFKFCINC